MIGNVKPLQIKQDYKCISMARHVETPHGWFLTDELNGSEIGFLVKSPKEYYYVHDGDIYMVFYHSYPDIDVAVVIDGYKYLMKVCENPHNSILQSSADMIREAIKKYSMEIINARGDT